jgi:hypothetical protein
MNLKELLDTIESTTQDEDGSDDWMVCAATFSNALPELRKELKRLKSVKKRMTSEKMKLALDDYFDGYFDRTKRIEVVLQAISDVLFPPKKPKGPVEPQNRSGRTGCGTATIIGATWGVEDMNRSPDLNNPLCTHPERLGPMVTSGRVCHSRECPGLNREGCRYYDPNRTTELDLGWGMLVPKGWIEARSKP